MAIENFYHGVEVVEIDDGIRPISTVRSSVIGLIGTADPIECPVSSVPYNEPTLIIGSRKKALEIFGPKKTGFTIPQALDAIFDQAGAMVVVVRVEKDALDATTISNVVGGVSGTEGVHAFSHSQSTVHVTPRILVAPHFSNEQSVLTEMIGVADQLRAVIIADGPNSSGSDPDADAITYRNLFGSSRIMMFDPWVKVYDTITSAPIDEPVSPRIAGIMSKLDNTKGFWWSPSNQLVNGILGTSRPVDYAFNGQPSRANSLNEAHVSTVIHQNGYRTWGNRSCESIDPKWQYLSVRRTADLIEESLQRAHQWAIDRNITKTYLEDVKDGVNAYLQRLKALGAILGGECYLDPELNTPENIQAGKVYFDFDFTPPYPAEHVTFRSHLVNDYAASLFSSTTTETAEEAAL
jgi:phage tail sheath protein FI